MQNNIHSYKNLLLRTDSESVHVGTASTVKDKVLVENTWYLFVLISSTKRRRGGSISVSVWKRKGKLEIIFQGKCSSSGFAMTPCLEQHFQPCAAMCGLKYAV